MFVKGKADREVGETVVGNVELHAPSKRHYETKLALLRGRLRGGVRRNDAGVRTDARPMANPLRKNGERGAGHR